MNKNYFWIVVTIVYFVLFALEALLSKHEVLIFDSELNLGLSMFLVKVLYTIASLQVVGPTELGAKIFFGRPTNEVSSGLVFVPLGFFQLAKETRLVIQDELPCDPEHIFRREDKENVPDGMFPPIRIPFGPPEKESDDPLDVRVTAEVVIIVRWKISKFITFLTTIGSREEARRQMQDGAIAMLTDAFAKITPAVALKDLATHNKNLKAEIEERVGSSADSGSGSWGIHMENAQIKAINFAHGLNEAIQMVPIATAKARATVLEAEGERKKRKLEGQGSGEAEQAILEGRTLGLKNMTDKLDVDPSAILGAETSRAITENPGQKTVIAGSQGFSNLVSTAAAVAEVFSTTKDSKEA